jgi:hypothetical protein
MSLSPFHADWPRYSVRDHNGDELAAFDSWGLAARSLREWGGVGSIVDTEDDSTQLVQGDES